MPKIPSEVKKIKKICLEALDDMKAQDVKMKLILINIRHLHLIS